MGLLKKTMTTNISKLKVAIVYSLPNYHLADKSIQISDEDTQDSAVKVLKALKKRKIKAFLWPVETDRLSSILEIKAEVIFNLIEWDGVNLPYSLKAFDYFQRLKIPVTGVSKKVYEATTNKILMKKAIENSYLPTPKWQVFYDYKDPIRNDFRYPLIVKLSQTHCSIGIDGKSLVINEKNLKEIVRKKIEKFCQPVIAEEFIDGREFQVSIIQDKEQVITLPPAEIYFRKSNGPSFLTFNSRWAPSHKDFDNSDIGLAKISPSLFSLIEELSIKAFLKLKIRDYGRIDMRIRNKKNAYDLFILEVNSNPGIDDEPDYGTTISCQAAGISFEDYIIGIIKSAVWRFTKRNLVVK